jgi:hypothetical protein
LGVERFAGAGEEADLVFGVGETTLEAGYVCVEIAWGWRGVDEGDLGEGWGWGV